MSAEPVSRVLLDDLAALVDCLQRTVAVYDQEVRREPPPPQEILRQRSLLLELERRLVVARHLVRTAERDGLPAIFSTGGGRP